MTKPAPNLEYGLSRLLEAYGSDQVLEVLSELAWERSQAGLTNAGQWRRIFIALQDVIVASRQTS